MAKPWIETLATELIDKGREAAETYGREQHRDGIIAAEGKVFFTAVTQSIEQDIADLRAQLQGSAISCETSALKESPTQLKLTRARFPWFEATLKHDNADDIVLDYTQGQGVLPADEAIRILDRKTIHFAFQVDPQDKLSIAEAFGERPRPFTTAEELAKYILETLFKV